MITANLNMGTVGQQLRLRGLEPNGKVQKFIDSECIRLMQPYIPMRTRTLARAFQQTKIGSGIIVQQTPYARYMYYGKLMVSPTTGSSYAQRGEKKVLTDIPLRYNRTASTQSGKLWFIRMKKDHVQTIRKGAVKVAERNRGG